MPEKKGPGAAATAPEADIECNNRPAFYTTNDAEVPSLNGGAAVGISPLDAAISHLRAGRSPIPVPLGSKAPKSRNWQKLRITEQNAPRYFNGAAQNIGILLGKASNWLVDVDLDCPEALSLSARFLPPTGSIFGHPSKRRSHWLYKAPGAKSERFADPTGGGMLVELRSTGAQTIFPPSTHTSGEAITWDADGETATIEAGGLTVACGRLAVACLIFRHVGAAALEQPLQRWPELLNA